MIHTLNTTRIFKDGNGVTRTAQLFMPYSEMFGPLEDYTYRYPDYPHVTAFRDEYGKVFAVLEPMQKVVDGWMLYLEAAEKGFKPISFSSQ